MMYTGKNNIPGIALFVDFKRKVFNAIEKDFINNCLKNSISDLTLKTGSKYDIQMFPAAF